MTSYNYMSRKYVAPKKDDSTSMGENNIPTTDSTSERVEMTHTLPDYTVKANIYRSSKPRMVKALRKNKQKSKLERKNLSNLITDNPFVPKSKSSSKSNRPIMKSMSRKMVKLPKFKK
jgi:hypothetical protein